MIDLINDETFLPRWINGELTEVELREFKKHPDYDLYVKIKDGTDQLYLPHYDLDTELRRIHDTKISKNIVPQKKVIRLFPLLAIAASILIVIGLFFYNPDTTISTGYGETLTVDLPDGSQTTLNAMSQIVYNKRDWKKNRSIKLNGEAFFDVTNGSTFKVETKNGYITVLGTQFNVNSDTDFFEVVCYEGMVKVSSEEKEKVLSKNEAFRFINGDAEDYSLTLQEDPTWLHNTSSFSSVPLKMVLQEIEDQYNITIEKTNLDLTVSYTGTFPNNNLDVALRTVFSTLGMNYRLSENKKDVMVQK
ncbi:FecR family protein [Aquimarina sp. W85]|uniref:FecR family protein n=1 Tax=Aquimarina rhodophyticola TaxID=3342246 RepID=UPI00366D0D31